MKARFFARLKRASALLAVLIVCLSFTVFGGGRYALKPVSASAEDNALIEIQRYELDMTVRRDRKIEVKEYIQVEFMVSGLSMFYRSLPKEGARYSDIEAACPNNPDFEYYVEDNPDESSYFDINCVGGVAKGNRWIYELSYIMEDATGLKDNGMIIDVVGFGWTVELHNVAVAVHFHESVESYEIYTDIFGVTNDNEITHELSKDGKNIYIYADVLKQGYSEMYNEYVTGGITLDFNLGAGSFGFATSLIFGSEIWKVLLGTVVAVGLALVLRIFTKSQRTVATVVNIKVPEGMDPLKMGTWLDGTANDEDITSMIYYFANEGYLRIDFSNEDDPCLYTRLSALPNEAPGYQKLLFNGLFQSAGACGSERMIYVSQAAANFYDAMQKAKAAAPKHPTMYEKKSIFGYVGCCVLGVALAMLGCFLMGARMGGGYKYYLGLLFALPVLAIGIMGYISENYRYKWKEGRRLAMLLGQVGISIAWTVLFAIFFAKYFMTGWEKVILSLGAFGCALVAQGTISRSESYVTSLADILGFKDFIVVTEEDKIKFMLEQNPQLYYHVLPYAQVLGVTDEWEEKFKALTIQPPQWYSGSGSSYGAHYGMHHSLNRAMARGIAAEVARRAEAAGGSVGKSGGGGSFGGFGGGGFGGGGGGAR